MPASFDGKFNRLRHLRFHLRSDLDFPIIHEHAAIHAVENNTISGITCFLTQLLKPSH